MVKTLEGTIKSKSLLDFFRRSSVVFDCVYLLNNLETQQYGQYEYKVNPLVLFPSIFGPLVPTLIATVLFQSRARRRTVPTGPTVFRTLTAMPSVSAPTSVPPRTHLCVARTASPTLTTAWCGWSRVNRRRARACSTAGSAVSTGTSCRSCLFGN
jgi:hypothetical protein